MQKEIMGMVVEVKVSRMAGNPDYAKCERCLNFYPKEDVGRHDYWPNFLTCKRCVGVLLDIQWPPNIMIDDNEFYVCESEKEWHEIKAGKKEIPCA